VAAGLAGLAIGNSFPLIPCGPGGLTDAIVATVAFLVLSFMPGPLRRRMSVLPRWQPIAPVMTAARLICPICFLLLCAAFLTGVAQGLAERILTTALTLWLGALAVTLIQVQAKAYQ
jgi:hypothetical protein